MNGSFLALIAVIWCCMVQGQTVYHVAMRGNDQNSGSGKRPLRTITAASRLAKPGDTILVHEGTYREHIDPPRGGTSGIRRITYKAAPGERVEIKGSEVVTGWKQLANGTWKAVLPESFFEGHNPYRELIYGDWFFPGTRKLHTGEVYLNGKALLESENLRDTLTWSCFAHSDNTVITANFGVANPNTHLTEINVRPGCFYPSRTGINYITVEGFHMLQAATPWAAPTAEQVGLIGTNWSKGWIIKDNLVSDSKCVGITLGKDRASGQNVWSADMSKDGAVLYNEMIRRVIAAGWNKENIGSHLVENNTIFRCGAAGICGSFGGAYSQILNNHIYDVYTRRIFGGAEMAGIKLHGAIDAVISGNRVHNTFIGIWLDWMAQGTKVKSNTLYDNDSVDFFPEVNHGPYVVDSNFFLSDFSLRDWSEGGMYTNNLFGGIISRAPQRRSTPYFKPHSTVLIGANSIRGGNNQFYDNIFMGRPDISVYHQQKMHAFEKPDSLRGYGLSIYDDATLPVTGEGNVYTKGARPLASEKSRQLKNKR